MTERNYLTLSIDKIPPEDDWLLSQPRPVVAIGAGTTPNADVVVENERDLQRVTQWIQRRPLASLVLVQVLRSIQSLPLESALTLESLAYSTLQGGSEFQNWLRGRSVEPASLKALPSCGDAVIMHRVDNTVYASLNRPQFRNSISVEMRDALVSLFELVLLDTTIERLELSGSGRCFSVGGELGEFGLANDFAFAHSIRCRQNPGRLLAKIAPKVTCVVHSACIGSGAEIPAFAGTVYARSDSFFQLPELQFGLIPGAGGCVSIARRIGRQRTAWMALSGVRVPARQAQCWGLIDRVI